jgi:hypothetical protein
MGGRSRLDCLFSSSAIWSVNFATTGKVPDNDHGIHNVNCALFNFKPNRT